MKLVQEREEKKTLLIKISETQYIDNLTTRKEKYNNKREAFSSIII